MYVYVCLCVYKLHYVCVCARLPHGLLVFLQTEHPTRASCPYENAHAVLSQGRKDFDRNDHETVLTIVSVLRVSISEHTCVQSTQNGLSTQDIGLLTMFQPGHRSHSPWLAMHGSVCMPSPNIQCTTTLLVSAVSLAIAVSWTSQTKTRRGHDNQRWMKLEARACPPLIDSKRLTRRKEMKYLTTERWR